jgi:DNA-directed RNA polymerase subunit F
MNYAESDDVRPADPVIKERLVPGLRGGRFLPYYQDTPEEKDEEEMLRQIMEQSALEYEIQQTILEENRKKSREERETHFFSTKRKFQQFAKLDADNRDFYNTLVSYIESYESGDRISVDVDQEFYTKFRRILENFRIGVEEKRRILAFILMG